MLQSRLHRFVRQTIHTLLIATLFGVGLYAAPAGAQQCWPTATPVGALPSQPPPVFCTIDGAGPGTAEAGDNRWIDDFDHGLSFASFDGAGYEVFDAVGTVHRSIHWRHADHWMVDIAPDAIDERWPDSAGGGAMIRPDQTFSFVDGKLVVEATFAPAIHGYDTLTPGSVGTAWGEIDVTTGSAPMDGRRGAGYGYDFFPGHYTLGCRMQPDTNIICSLMDNTDRGLLDGGRMWEMSFFQHVGTEVFGGNDFVERGSLHQECGPGVPDAQCRMTFRMELTETSVAVYIDDTLYFEQTGIPPLPTELLEGDLHVYAASMLGRHDADTVRFHWDRFAVNPDNTGSGEGGEPGELPGCDPEAEV